MRLTLTYTILFVYLTYLFVSSFPVLTYCMYRNIAINCTSGEVGTSNDQMNVGDFNYLKAIKERAGIKDEPDKNPPPKVSNENLQITCIISDRDHTAPHLWNKKSKYFLYQNQYVDNFPEVAVPPPKSA